MPTAAMLLIRCDKALADRFRQCAGARLVTQAQYLTALLDFLDNIQALARERNVEDWQEEIRGYLVLHGLQTVKR